MNFHLRLQEEKEKGALPSSLIETVAELFESYVEAAKQNNVDTDISHPIFNQYLDLVTQEVNEKTPFHSFHEKVIAPFDYFKFGIDFIRPVVRVEESQIFGDSYLDEINDEIVKGNNVILMANHQSELDPQAMALLLQENYPILLRSLIFVAGHRVTNDPLAIPFSLGCNLLCIYSKHYIEHPIEKRHEKILHNSRSMRALRKLLDEGGKCIYVAPSGGRDRFQDGMLLPRPFDPQSVEVFNFLSNHAKKKTTLYPFALYTHYLSPPPETIQKELGEKRKISNTELHLAFGKPFEKTKIVKQMRDEVARKMWQRVFDLYQTIHKE
ncbi:MAG: 1-acyl-sn-glycerol-3-phosphate acyltransferase [Waddliaceae bacterium]